MRRGILAGRDELRALRDRISRKPFDAIYDTLRKRCSLILQTQPITEAHWRAMWEQGSWSAALQAARTAQGRMLDLIIAHHIDPNAAYRDRAVEELKSLIGWSTWADPCHAPLAVDLCTAEAAVGATVALDWLWEDLSEPDRLRVLHAIRHKVIAPYRKCVAENVWWYDCYHNWNAVVNAGCGLAALALSDEEPSAKAAYNLARAGLRHFFDALGREGGWDEGVGYWAYAMRYVLLLGEAAARTTDDLSVFHCRGMDATGVFPVYFTPNGHSASFGDAPSVPLWGTLYLLVKHYGLKELTWWLDTYAFHRDVSSSGWSAAGLAMLFRPVDAETTSSPDLAAVKVFNEIGWAAMADRWPRPSMYVAAKTGDLSANHSQRDMNSIQLQVDGEMLLVDLGHPPYSREYFSEARSDFYEVQARAHNTIVVAGRDHRIDAQGAVVEAQSDRSPAWPAGGFHWIAADAGAACGDNVHFVRHVIMTLNTARQVGTAVIVLDEIANPSPERIDLFWHTFGEVELDPSAASGRIVGQLSAVHFALASTSKIAVSRQSRALDGHRHDNVIQVSSPPAGRAMFVSVFSRSPIKDRPRIKSLAAGGAKVRAGNLELSFRMLKRRLHLEGISEA